MNEKKFPTLNQLFKYGLILVRFKTNMPKSSGRKHSTEQLKRQFACLLYLPTVYFPLL